MKIIKDVTSLMRALGGDRAIADRTGLTPSAVRQWKFYDRVPVKYQPILLPWCAELKLYISHDLWTRWVRPGPKPGTTRQSKRRKDAAE